jgi:hypothetical protein
MYLEDPRINKKMMITHAQKVRGCEDIDGFHQCMIGSNDTLVNRAINVRFEVFTAVTM